MNGEQLYLHGFNNAYLLAQHEPALLSKLVSCLTATNDYFQGFFSGKAQYEMEQTKTQLANLQQIRNRAQERGQERERE